MFKKVPQIIINYFQGRMEEGLPFYCWHKLKADLETFIQIDSSLKLDRNSISNNFSEYALGMHGLHLQTTHLLINTAC